MLVLRKLEHGWWRYLCGSVFVAPHRIICFLRALCNMGLGANETGCDDVLLVAGLTLFDVLSQESLWCCKRSETGEGSRVDG